MLSPGVVTPADRVLGFTKGLLIRDIIPHAVEGAVEIDRAAYHAHTCSAATRTLWLAGSRDHAQPRRSSIRGRPIMAKVLRCGDLMPGCNAVIEGKDEAEVMAKGAEHAKTAHKMTAIPPEMAAKVKAAIKEKQ
jgi:predicted small metal-binding protein